jgi:hypothetical protein
MHGRPNCCGGCLTFRAGGEARPADPPHTLNRLRRSQVKRLREALETARQVIDKQEATYKAHMDSVSLQTEEVRQQIKAQSKVERLRAPMLSPAPSSR